MPTQEEVLIHVHEAPETELCPHGYPEGRGCKECEFWERVDYESDRHRDNWRRYAIDEPARNL